MADDFMDDLLPELDIFDTNLPFIPDQGDDWEAQEIRRHYHNSLRALRVLAEQAIGQYHRLAVLTGDRFDYRPGGGSLSYQAIQAETSLVSFARVLDGAVHRQAWLRNGDPSARELVMLKSLAEWHDVASSNPDQCPCDGDHCVLTEPWVPAEYRRNGPPAKLPEPAE